MSLDIDSTAGPASGLRNSEATGRDPAIEAMIRALSEEADSYSRQARARQAGQYPLPRADIVLYLGYGQSNSVGFECFPVLSRDTTSHDCVMLGGSVHSRYRTRPVFETMDGTLDFSPLRGRIREPGEDSGLVPEDEEGSVTAGMRRPGETPLEGMVAAIRHAWLRHRGPGRAGERPCRFGAASVGVGGQTIAALSGELFNRFIGCIAAWKAACDAQGLSFAVGGVLWHQGETDYGRDVATPFDAYANSLTALIGRMREEVSRQTGQAAASIPVFMMQSGARCVPVKCDLPVGRAQLAVAAAVPGVFVIGNQQRYPAKSVHLSTNGTRWLGNQAGRVAALVQIEGKGWEPTRLLAARHRGTTILATAHAPVPPLQLAPAFRDLKPVLLETGGLQAIDEVGPHQLSAVRFVAPQVMMWTTERPIAGPLRLWLGRQKGTWTTINIADSDDAPLPGHYEFLPGSAQDAAEDRPDLNGRPYDPRNLAVADIIESEPF